MNAESPLVSILIPTYNAAPYLPELCRSLLVQTYPQFEAVILDDGSTDRTHEVLQPFLTDERFRLIVWKQNRGLNAGLRQLLNEAKGKYWVSPGADDVLLPDFLKHRVEAMEAQPNVIMVHGPGEIINERSETTPNPFQQARLPALVGGERALGIILQHNVINQPSAVIRTDATRRILPYYTSDWKYAPDWHLWILLFALGMDWAWDARVLHKYRVHGGSLSGDPAKAATRRAEIRLAPLSALSAAREISALGAETWARWGKELYRLWLLRAAKLRREGLLKEEWIRAGAEAFYGPGVGLAGLTFELLRHALGMFAVRWAEQRALRGQFFGVSGLARIDDPVFR